MTIERRLHHAARELREVPIDVPALGELLPRSHRRSTRRQSRLPVFAAPLLFIAGGVLAVGVMQQQVPEPTQSDIPAVSAVVDAGPAPVERSQLAVPAPSVRDELQLIAGLLSDPPPSPPPVPNVAGAGVIPLAGTGPS